MPPRPAWDIFPEALMRCVRPYSSSSRVLNCTACLSMKKAFPCCFVWRAQVSLLCLHSMIHMFSYMVQGLAAWVVLTWNLYQETPVVLSHARAWIDSCKHSHAAHCTFKWHAGMHQRYGLVRERGLGKRGRLALCSLLAQLSGRARTTHAGTASG
eukprot:1160269-Pelagomonas_calceolata.AAC.5